MDLELINQIMKSIDDHIYGYVVAKMKSDILHKINNYYISKNPNEQLYQVIVDRDRGRGEYEKLDMVYEKNKIKPVAEYIANKVNTENTSHLFFYDNARVVAQEK